MSQYGGVKEVQAHLRYARATTTLDISIQEIPASVRIAVEKLDETLASAHMPKDSSHLLINGTEKG